MKFNITRGLVRYNNQFLLLKRAIDPIPENIGKWECVGGRLEEHENPKENILREIEKKINVTGTIAKEVSYFNYHVGDIQSQCHVFLINIDSNDIQLTDTHSEFKFVNAEQIQNENLVLFASLLLEYFRNAEFYGLLK